MTPVVLVEDAAKPQKIKELQESYGSEVKLVSALWFYFSVYFLFELPIEPFVITTETN